MTVYCIKLLRFTKCSNLIKKCAFTLAEVLITLGIIGVVAAMTLPVLIQNHQKTVWVNQLKKSVSVLENGFKLMMASDEVYELSDTTAFRTIGSYHYSTDNNTAFNKFSEDVKKYFKIAKIDFANSSGVTYKHLNNNSSDSPIPQALYLNDGNILYIYMYPGPEVENGGYLKDCDSIKQLGGNLCYFMGSVLVDVNGKKGPNVYGRDLFNFVVDNNGKLYPAYGKDFALYKSQTDLSNNSFYWKNDNCRSCMNEQAGSSNGCAARIIENSWKMDY